MINAQNCHLKTRRNAKIEKPSGPWFDKECADVKNNLRKLGRKLKQEPANTCVREKLLQQKRLFKKLTKQKKYNYKCSILNNVCQKSK